jgi:hypothetical protein
LAARDAERHAKEQIMIEATKIKAHMPVVCSEDGQFAIVDHMEGKSTIKLAKDSKGQHHYIPLSWRRLARELASCSGPTEAILDGSYPAQASTLARVDPGVLARNGPPGPGGVMVA